MEEMNIITEEVAEKAMETVQEAATDAIEQTSVSAAQAIIPAAASRGIGKELLIGGGAFLAGVGTEYVAARWVFPAIRKGVKTLKEKRAERKQKRTAKKAAKEQKKAAGTETPAPATTKDDGINPMDIDTKID